MKKALFLITHECSGSNILRKALDKTSRVQFFENQAIYAHFSNVENLTSQNHKLKNVAAIWAEELLYNYQFQSKRLYDSCKFIYFIRDAKSTLGEVVKKRNESQSKTLYYTYRLRRIFEMARKTPNAIWMTYDDLIAGRKIDFVEKYLYLREPLEINHKFEQTKHNNFISNEQISYAERAYERYYYKLSKLNFSFSTVLG